MKSLVVTVKIVYDKPTIYPICREAELFCKLLKQKTLTMTDVSVLEELGYTFDVKPTALRGA